MRQFVHCNGCNNQVPTPESLDGKPSPQFLKCEACGNEFFWNGGLTDNSEPLILFSIEDSIEDSVESLETPEDLEEVAEIEPAAEPLSLAIAENTKNEDSEVQTETFESVAQPLESEPSLSGSLTPQEIVILPQVELDSPTQLEPGPIVNETVPESFELELEIESEPDTQFSESETPQPSATENATEIAAGHEEEPFVLGAPYLATEPNTEPNTETLASEHASVAELAVPLDSSPAVDWSVLGPTVPRRRPKEASAIRKILPPVLGGLAAFPIATLILWYGFGKDIGTTGPTVAKYVPWIVPEKFRSMPFDSSPPSFASGRTQRSAPSTRSTLPTLNRDETTVPPNNNSNASAPDIASKKPEVALEKPTTPAEPKAEPVRETAVAKIPETLEALKSLLKQMENAVGKTAKKKVFIAINAKLKELSKQSSELTGPSSRTWSKELEAISRKILADSVIPNAMKLIANCGREEIPASVAGDFVATVIEVSDGNMPSQNDKWLLQEKWESDQAPIPIEVLPGAWLPGSSPLPATCLVLGRLLPMEDSDAIATAVPTGTGLVLKVHLLVPK